MELVLILDNIRSLHNVGSIFRIADGAGVNKIYLTGITGYPQKQNDTRPPWEVEKVSKGVHKTALGAEEYVDWEYVKDIDVLVDKLKRNGYQIASLELTDNSVNIFQLSANGLNDKVALVVGNEIDGVSKSVLETSDLIIHIPMSGKKKSLNVATATAVAVYELLNK